MTEDQPIPAPLIPPVGEDLRYCNCADPENCTEPIPGYVCKPRTLRQPVGEDDPWKDVNQYHWNHANEDARPCLNANCCRPHCMDGHQVEAALTLTRQQHAEQEERITYLTQALEAKDRDTTTRDVLNAAGRRQFDRAEALAEQIAEKDADIRRYSDAASDQLQRAEAAESREAALRATLEDAHAVCVCGCPIDEHESYGEDGETCALGHLHGDCIRTSKAVLSIVAALRAELATVTTDRDFHKGQHEKWVAVASRNGTALADTTDALTEAQSNYLGACALVARMHAAAVGEVTGPKRGVVEDIEDLRAERDEFQEAFDLRWKADMRAIARWREAHPGNELVQPDHADLCVWLLDALATLKQEVVDLTMSVGSQDEIITLLRAKGESGS